MSACDVNPCQNGGACAIDNSADGYTCTCATGYFGVNCTVSSLSSLICKKGYHVETFMQYDNCVKNWFLTC